MNLPGSAFPAPPGAPRPGAPSARRRGPGARESTPPLAPGRGARQGIPRSAALPPPRASDTARPPAQAHLPETPVGADPRTSFTCEDGTRTHTLTRWDTNTHTRGGHLGRAPSRRPRPPRRPQRPHLLRGSPAPRIRARLRSPSHRLPQQLASWHRPVPPYIGTGRPAPRPGTAPSAAVRRRSSQLAGGWRPPKSDAYTAGCRGALPSPPRARRPAPRAWVPVLDMFPH